MLPDENDLDFTWSITHDGGGILVTPAVQNLTVNLEETQRHVVPITQRLSPLFTSTLIFLSVISF